jgi:hypothetical protein
MSISDRIQKLDAPTRRKIALGIFIALVVVIFVLWVSYMNTLLVASEPTL